MVDLLKNARQPMLSVCLSDTIQRVLDPIEGEEGHAQGPGQPATRPGAVRSGERQVAPSCGERVGAVVRFVILSNDAARLLERSYDLASRKAAAGSLAVP